MPRGGHRDGAGGVPIWKHGKTKTIRVPIALANELLDIARALDNGEKLILQSKLVSDAVTESKVLDLSGILIRQHKGIISIYLEDLTKRGYKLQPESLALMVEARMRRVLEQ